MMIKPNTMVKRKPTLLATETQSDSVVLTFKVDSDILDFTGHFPHFPLLPGVTQIDWALHYARQYLLVPSAFKGMEVVKFQEPILPDATIQLTLVWDAEKNKLSFSYNSQRGDNTVTHSSGKMKLGEPSV